MAFNFSLAAGDDPFAPVTCQGCKKQVFASEKVTALKASWHKGCLKCATCGFTLNPRNLESYQNVPYCKSHKPDPKATQVADSIAVKQATDVPKAARRVQGIDKNSRMTFAPGSQAPIKAADTGAHHSSRQHDLAPQQKFVAPEPTPSITSYVNEGPLVKNVGNYGGANEDAYSGNAYATDDSTYNQGEYDQGSYDQTAYAQDQGTYDQGGYEEGSYDQTAYTQDQGYAEGGEEGYYEEGQEYYAEGGEEGYYDEGQEYYEESYEEGY